MKVLADPSGNAGIASAGSLMEKYWHNSEVLTPGKRNMNLTKGSLRLKQFNLPIRIVLILFSDKALKHTHSTTASLRVQSYIHAKRFWWKMTKTTSKGFRTRSKTSGLLQVLPWSPSTTLGQMQHCVFILLTASSFVFTMSDITITQHQMPFPSSCLLLSFGPLVKSDPELSFQ